MAGANFRTDEIVSMSITEILLIIIFALVLVAQIFQSKLQDEREQNASLLAAAETAREIDSNAAVITSLFGQAVEPAIQSAQVNAVLTNAGSTLKELKIRIDEVFGVVGKEGRIPETWSELKRLADSVKSLGAEGEGLAKAVSELSKENSVLEQQISSYKQEQSKINELKGKFGVNSLTELGEAFEGMKTESLVAEANAKSLKGKNRELNTKILKMGYGKIPCWTDDSGNEEYLMNIQLGEGNLTTIPAYPDYRGKDLNSLPIDRASLRKSYSVKEFAQMFRPIFEWGKHTGKDCRFFARIKDDGATTKKGYLASRRAVEDLFFIFDIDFNKR